MAEEKSVAMEKEFNSHLLSRQTESVRDHKFHSGYAHSSMVYR